MTAQAQRKMSPALSDWTAAATASNIDDLVRRDAPFQHRSCAAPAQNASVKHGSFYRSSAAAAAACLLQLLLLA
jgi:hypothetical protein